RAERYAEARGYGRNPITAVAAPEQRIVHQAPCEEAASIVVVMMGDRGYLALDAPHVLADLVIVANLAAGDEAAVIAPEPLAPAPFLPKQNSPPAFSPPMDPVVVISFDQGAADVAANVEASPAVHDRSSRWRRLQGHVRCLCGTPQHHRGEHAHSKQERLWHKRPHLAFCAAHHCRLDGCNFIASCAEGPSPVSNVK